MRAAAKEPVSNEAPPFRVTRPRVAEFFAGIGLVRAGLEAAGFEVVFANDVDPGKHHLYAANFPASDFVLADVRSLQGTEIPIVDLATASFPCADLSLAGNRSGFKGRESSLFWEFHRILSELETRPMAVLLENVPSFATSQGGEDLRAAIQALNELGYCCDLFVADSRHFVPQSRPRLFIVGSIQQISPRLPKLPDPFRPSWIEGLIRSRADMWLQCRPLSVRLERVASLSDVVDRLHAEDPRWWDTTRVERFLETLSPIQARRIGRLRSDSSLTWATAYRRTRSGRPVWEVRADRISGCLRTARGGSSKQALVEAGGGKLRVRWMTPREYARLQGAPDFDFADARESQILWGFGDAVCVPVIQWIATDYLRPMLDQIAAETCQSAA